jgi:hypothetical protein
MMRLMTPIRRSVSAVFIAFVCAASLGLAAQEVKIGSLEGSDAVFTTASASTIIDWSRPATAVGTVNTASVAWTNATAPCDNIFYVRFYVIPNNALQAVMTAERGPFRAVNGINTVALEPPVTTTLETYIAVRRAGGDGGCGQPYGSFTRQARRAFFTTDNFTFGSLAALNPAPNFTLLAQASNVPAVRVSTIPIVGAAPGNFGSFFRTALTLANPSPFPIDGKLLFHPIAHAGADTDPALSYTIPPNGSLDYPDIVAAAGLSGIYSLDILTTASFTPIANARVFNDAGIKGTSGLTEEAVPAGATYDSVANVLIPTDPANFRLNVGIRTITAGDLGVTVYDAAGHQQASLLKSYDANYFEQVAASDFVNGAALPPGGRIVIKAYQKEFIVYGSATDNRTNDPNMRIGSD